MAAEGITGTATLPLATPGAPDWVTAVKLGSVVSVWSVVPPMWIAPLVSGVAVKPSDCWLIAATTMLAKSAADSLPE